jgi:hypothetical protein
MTDTLKSLCEECRHINNPCLDFVPDGLLRYKEIILRDLAELVLAASNESEKSVVALAGSVLEAVLFVFLKTQEVPYLKGRRGAEFKLRPEWRLRKLVQIFKKDFVVVLPSFPRDLLADEVVSQRNLIHAGQEAKFTGDACRLAARTMLRTLDALLGALAAFGTPE